jgi:hypothetical protein
MLILRLAAALTMVQSQITVMFAFPVIESNANVEFLTTLVQLLILESDANSLLVLQLQTHEKLPSLLDASINDGWVNGLDPADTTSRHIAKADGVQDQLQHNFDMAVENRSAWQLSVAQTIYQPSLH